MNITNELMLMVDEKRTDIEASLPKNCISFDQMKKSFALAIANSKNNKLSDCTKLSLYTCFNACVESGLSPNPVLGFCYIIPYGKVATMMVSYKGMIELALRSGKIKTLHACIVYEKDKFDYEMGMIPTLKHKPFIGSDAGKVIAAYAVARHKDDTTQFDIMNYEEIEKTRKRSKAATNGPWVTDWNEMAKKTVVRRLYKYLPVSIEDKEQALQISRWEEADFSTKPEDANFTVPQSQNNSLDSLTQSLEVQPEDTIGDEARITIIKHFTKYKVTEQMILDNFGINDYHFLNHEMMDELSKMYESMEKSESEPAEFFPEMREKNTKQTENTF